MSQNYTHYKDTAYDSRTPRELPLGNNTTEDGVVQRHNRQGRFIDRGVQCGEFLAKEDKDIIDAINATEGGNFEDMKEAAHEKQLWSGWANPRVAVDLLKGVMAFFWITSILGIVFLFLVTGFDFHVFLYIWIFPGIPYAIYWICKLALKHNWVKDKNNTELNRCTGMLTFPWKKKMVTLPFDEFEPGMPAGVNPTGSHNYYLRLVHKYSDMWTQDPAAHNDYWQVQLAWEYWQQFMDISKPLPDVPRMEPFRDRDPVTVAWDKKHKRPKDYWKNMIDDMDRAERMIKKSRQAAESYPWGLNLNEAKASGWRPSGVGQGDWRKKR